MHAQLGTLGREKGRKKIYCLERVYIEEGGIEERKCSAISSSCYKVGSEMVRSGMDVCAMRNIRRNARDRARRAKRQKRREE